MDGVEESGRTVQAAIEKALHRLGLDITQVDTEVISEGRGGILGFGAAQAKVRVTPRAGVSARPRERGGRGQAPGTRPPRSRTPRPQGYRERITRERAPRVWEATTEAPTDEAPAEAPTPRRERPVRERQPVGTAEEGAPAAEGAEPASAQADIGVEVLENLLNFMGLEAEINVREPETPGDGLGLTQAVLDVTGDDLGLLIGRRGQTLASLQYLLNLIVSRKMKARAALAVDVEGYKRRREESLHGLALRMAERVRSTGRSVTLEPMPPSERRIVHLALAEDANVVTVSIGEGENRKVAITPRR